MICFGFDWQPARLIWRVNGQDIEEYMVDLSSGDLEGAVIRLLCSVDACMSCLMANLTGILLAKS